MSEFENYWKINCILVELEQLKQAVRELEEMVKERNLKDVNDEQ